MSTTELKEEIQKAIEHVPENALDEILRFVKTKQMDYEAKLDEIFERVLTEDHEVLQKLAK